MGDEGTPRPYARVGVLVAPEAVVLAVRGAGGQRSSMLALSQIIFGVRDLDVATRRFETLGFEVLDGGVHPGVGTANRVIPLGAQYLELLGVVDEQRAEHSEYGRSLIAATATGDRLVRWSLRTDTIDAVAERLGLAVEARRRERPDGHLLTWRAAGLGLALADATTPFFMQWDDPLDYPGALPAAHRNRARGVAALTVIPAELDQFTRWTAGADAPLRVREGSVPRLLNVEIDTPKGRLVIPG